MSLAWTANALPLSYSRKLHCKDIMDLNIIFCSLSSQIPFLFSRCLIRSFPIERFLETVIQIIPVLHCLMARTTGINYVTLYGFNQRFCDSPKVHGLDHFNKTPSFNKIDC